MIEYRQKLFWDFLFRQSLDGVTVVLAEGGWVVGWRCLFWRRSARTDSFVFFGKQTEHNKIKIIHPPTHTHTQTRVRCLGVTTRPRPSPLCCWFRSLGDSYSSVVVCCLGFVCLFVFLFVIDS